MASESTSVVGMDLGTTESRIAVWKDGKVEIIPERWTKRSGVPSCVSFFDTMIYVGGKAKEQMGSHPKNTVFDLKQLIGRDTDCSLQPTCRIYWPFRVSRCEGKAQISVDKGNETRTFYPERMLSWLLQRLLENTKLFLGFNVTRVVMTVPTYFNANQRNQATSEVAEWAEVTHLHVIDDCIAAALAYCFEKNLRNVNHLLVYDMGTYCFQVSVLNMKDLHPELVVSVSNPVLGGKNFDDLLVSKCLKKIPRDIEPKLMFGPELMSKLYTACENSKKMLSVQNETAIQFNDIWGSCDYTYKISRHEFENLCADTITTTLNIVESTLRKGGIEKSQVQHIVLVGGSTRMPKLVEMVKDFFEWTELDMSIAPEECVVYGAAVAGALLSGRIQQDQNNEDGLPGWITERKIIPFQFNKHIELKVRNSSMVTETHPQDDARNKTQKACTNEERLSGYSVVNKDNHRLEERNHTETGTVLRLRDSDSESICGNNDPQKLERACNTVEENRSDNIHKQLCTFSGTENNVNVMQLKDMGNDTTPKREDISIVSEEENHSEEHNISVTCTVGNDQSETPLPMTSSDHDKNLTEITDSADVNAKSELDHNSGKNTLPVVKAHIICVQADDRKRSNGNDITSSEDSPKYVDDKNAEELTPIIDIDSEKNSDNGSEIHNYRFKTVPKGQLQNEDADYNMCKKDIYADEASANKPGQGFETNKAEDINNAYEQESALSTEEVTCTNVGNESTCHDLEVAIKCKQSFEQAESYSTGASEITSGDDNEHENIIKSVNDVHHYQLTSDQISGNAYDITGQELDNGFDHKSRLPSRGLRENMSEMTSGDASKKENTGCDLHQYQLTSDELSHHQIDIIGHEVENDHEQMSRSSKSLPEDLCICKSSRRKIGFNANVKYTGGILHITKKNLSSCDTEWRCRGNTCVKITLYGGLVKNEESDCSGPGQLTSIIDVNGIIAVESRSTIDPVTDKSCGLRQTELDEVRAELQEIRDKEATGERKDAARRHLEEYVYELKHVLTYESGGDETCKEENRRATVECDQMLDFLDDESEQTEEVMFVDKLKKFKEEFGYIMKRRNK